MERRILAGQHVDGWKVVQGKKGNRQWSDQEAVEPTVALLALEEKAYARKLLTPTHLEKGLGTTEARTLATTSQQTTTITNDTMRNVFTITELSAGPIAITEVGVFDAAGSGSPPTGGNMDIYGDFSAINVNSGDSIQFTVNTKFT